MKFLLSAFFLSLAAAAALGQGAGQLPAPTQEPPQVHVEAQAGAPLRILSVKTKWAVPDRTTIELFITVENASGKAISAYATRDPADADAEKSRPTCLLIHAPSPGKALRAGHSEGRSTWRGHDPAARLRRMVDFVEFTDGTTWGEDRCGSAERLAASRAGAREARRRLRQLFAAGGADAVVEAISPDGLKVSPPEGFEAEWRRFEALREDARRRWPLRGRATPDDTAPWARPVSWWLIYEAGFTSYAGRVRREVEEWGPTEVGHALGRPLDALEER